MNAEAVRAWLEVHYDYDEVVAREARCGGEGRWHQTDPDRETGRIEDDLGEVVVYDEGSPTAWQAEHIDRHDPARVEREIAAKRRRLERHRPVEEKAWKADVRREVVIFVECSACMDANGERRDWPCPDIIDDAQAYRDEPGFPAELRLP